jgi:Zn-dependent protease
MVTVSLVAPDWTSPLAWIIGIAASLIFFASVLAHELAHSLVGRRYGVVINSITLFLLGGLAQMQGEAKTAGAEFRMAIAGPAASFAIGILFGLIYLATQSFLPESIAIILAWLGLINAALAVFNLIPGFPLDGGRVFRSILWRSSGSYGKATRIATRLGQVVGYLFITGGVIIIISSFFGGYFDIITGIWAAFIGWFLQNAASASYRQERWRMVLEPFTAADVMSRELPVVPAEITVGELVRSYVLPTGRRYFLIMNEGRLLGMITLHNIKAVPQNDWEIARVNAIMTPAASLKTVLLNQSALSVLEMMATNDINQVPVVSDDRVVGVVARDNLLRFLRTHSELGGRA